MNEILDSAHAWFFDGSSHQLNGAVVVRLVEGIKGKERQFLDVGDTKMGPYFPVQVEEWSRVVSVTFSHVLAFFVYDESYDSADPELKKGSGRFLFKAEASSFRNFAETKTTVAQLNKAPYDEYLICCEDRIFQVLADGEPNVMVLQERPNLLGERTNTWAAS